MLKTLRKIKTELFPSKSQREKNNIPLFSHIKHAGYTEEEVNVIKDHYSFFKVNDDDYYIYKNDFTKEVLEITPLGNLCTGRIDLHNYKLDEIDNTAW